MRRRSSLLLAFFASSALSAPLIGCGPAPEKPKVYKSFAECAADLDATTCKTAFDSAKAEHDKTAPKFTAKAQCEAEYGVGQCESKGSTNGGGGVFVPMMMGYMLGSMGNNSYPAPVYNDRYRDRDRYDNRYNGGYVPPPSYNGNNNRSVSSSSRSYDSSGYRSSTRPSYSTSTSGSSRAYSGVTSRGGFGASAASHGGCCG